MRALWMLAVGLACALSALVAAVWVAASGAVAEPDALRVARQVLADDAAATRRLLALSCERDVRVERFLLELSAGDAAEGAAQLARELAPALGGQVELYLVRSGTLMRLAGARERPLSLLRRAARARVLEEEQRVLDACQREQAQLSLWIARSESVGALLAQAELGPDAFAFTRDGAPDVSDAPGAAPVALGADGSTLRLRARGDASPPPRWLVPAALCAAAAFVLGALLGLWFYRKSPLEEAVLSTIEQAAERVGRGDLSSTIDLRLGGRADQTFRRFDRMTAELRETRARLQEAERAAAWQDMARRVAHEIKNPLSPIKMGLETLRKAHDKRLAGFDEIFAESTHAMLEEVQRLEHIVREFSEFARLPKARPGALDLARLSEEVAKLYAPEGMQLTLRLGEAVTAHADREQISQVIVNLLNNAVDAARAGPVPRVALEVACEGKDAVLRVDDNGPGVPEADRMRIFEPYVTGKEHGTGLGLAIVRRIVQDHGGTIGIEASPLGGARFEVRLPVSADARRE